MLMVNQGPGGALSARRCPLPSSPLNSSHKHLHHHHHQQTLLSSNTSTAPPNHTLSVPPHSLTSTKRRHPLHPTLAKPDSDTNGAATATTTTTTTTDNSSSTVYVGQENVPLEGVIQFDKPKSSFSSQLDKWGRIGLLAGGDVLALLLFAAIGRYSHGLSVFDTETLRTADPFIAGWFLGAYFLGGYGEDGCGMKGRSSALIAVAKSWAVGIPLGLIIRAATSGHIPPYTFVLVTMGTTGVLLITWRALSYNILPRKESKKDDMYRQGNPFELFELLTSLIRRW